jgi:methylglutaconyl-CoA hydratase
MSTLHVATGPVTTVTLNRPQVRNALDDQLIRDLRVWAQSTPDDGSVRVAVLQGAGPVFCAGADLRWMERMAGVSHDQNVADALDAAAMFLALDRLPVPLVARVHGAAMGGGVGLAAVSDIVVAADDSRFGLAETTLGLVPAMIAPYLVRKMGVTAARARCLNGAPFSAREAAEVGLVQHVVAASDLDAAVSRVVASFAQASPAAVIATKRLFGEVAGRAPEDVAAMTAQAIAAARASTDGREGLRAFFERRAPAWATPLEWPSAAVDPARRS